MIQPIPFTVLGGYLGSGKTTLLNRVLQQNEGRRLAVIVNDFGSVNIDAMLIQTRTNELVALANGCVCCSISTGLAEALTVLSRRTPLPEHVIIEASGVADPIRVGYFGSAPPYHLDGIVVLADAEAIREQAADKYVGSTVQRQLRGADLIVLNKIDLLTDTQQADLTGWLREQVADARIIATSHGRVSLPLLLGLHVGSVPPIKHHDHDHGDGYASWSVAVDAPIDESMLRATVSAWPDTVLRAKGIVYLAEDRQRRQVFQLVGRRWSLTPDRPWGSDTPRTELVLIGLDGTLDGEALLAPLTTVAARV
jgi:G3E family GTPase